MILKSFFIRLILISIVKLLGALGKIPLYRMVGAEGIGLYQIAYSYYGLVLTLITFGMPTAISLVTASNPAKGLSLLKRSAVILLCIGGFTGWTTCQFASSIVKLVDDPHLLWAIQAVSPAFIIVPILSLLRGYLHGLQNYTLIAFSEVFEQTIRISIMLLCVSLWIPYGIDFAISGATLAASVSAFCTLGFLFFFFQRISDKQIVSIRTHPIQKFNFLHSSLFILSTQFIIPLSDFIATIIIPNRLEHSGMNIHEATAVLGQYFGMGSMIINIPTIITSSLCHVLLPKLCTDWEMNRLRSLVVKIKKLLTLTLLWGIFSAFLLMYFSKEISILIIGDPSLHFYLFYLSIAPLFAGLQITTTTALWAVGDQKNPLISLIIGSCISTLLYYFTIGIHGYEYIGIVLGFLAVDTLSSIWNMGSLYRKWKLHYKGRR